MKKIFTLTNICIVGHIAFFAIALGAHPSWISGSGEFSPVQLLYLGPMFAFMLLDMVTNLTPGVEKIVFFIVGFIQWYSIGQYFDNSSSRAR